VSYIHRRKRMQKPSLTKVEVNGEHTSSLVSVSEPMSTGAEAYRALGTNVLYAGGDAAPKVVLLTGPGAGEGKSTTCANLAVVLAQAGKSVLLVDCDLRKPALHRMFGLRNVFGLVDVLTGERDLREVYQDPMPGLKMVTAGPALPIPAKVLSSRRFPSFLQEVRQEFDCIVLDAPPVETTSDPAILAAQVDGVLLVFDARGTRKGALRRSIRRLEAVGANLLGTVMNNVRTSKSPYYNSAYYRYSPPTYSD
jgi:capsular exopolysaccharide synthesis family protein